MTRWRRCALAMLAAAATGCATTPPPPTKLDFSNWPVPERASPPDPALEAEVARLLAGMSLEQKVGQMTQAEIRSITPDEVRRHFIGSVLNGGGSVPGGQRRASVGDWLALAERLHEASMAVDSPVKVPLIWGTDAVHGHNNLFGATLFPHHIGLGAAHEPELAGRVAAATARAVRASGVRWAFAPTVAVARDVRWGRTYESWSEDPALVRAYAQAQVAAMQGRLSDDGTVLATAKHFIGDGGTELGRDQGVNRASAAELRDVHAAGYYGALAAGVQTVMVSFNSWQPLAEGSDPGKLHGSKAMLTDLLKGRLGFDGIVVTDWNGINQVPGCSSTSCPQAINAGVDMVMVPDDWKAFITNTLAQVKSGAIPQARIDDAVSRILRVKLRAGLFGQRPSSGAHAGRFESTQARELAREAVRKSLVLLKNTGGVLPLPRGRRVLVVGRGADSLEMQTGGWTLSWQGTGNPNANFPNGTSILAGIAEAAGPGNVVYSPDAAGVDVAAFDAVIAVLGEAPYAEGNGDIPPSGTLRHSSRYPADLAVLQAVSGRGRPVVTVLLSGRPLFVNDLLNRSDAFVAAWLPGSEGAGVADLLFRRADGRVNHDFQGRLPFSWPKGACQAPLYAGMPGYDPLFPRGHGLHYADTAPAAAATRLDESSPADGCVPQSVLTVFQQTARPPYALLLSSPTDRWPEAELARDPNAVLQLPDATVSTVQLNTQQDAQRVAWTGPARLYTGSSPRAALNTFRDGALLFDLRVLQAPQAPVVLAMGCGEGCGAELDFTDVLRRLPLNTRRTLKLPLACFGAAGVDLSRVDEPFSLSTRAAFTADFAHVRIVSGAARDPDALRCHEFPALPASNRP